MNINDRGTKKWTSIMTVEQQETLLKLWEMQEWKEQPILDEQLIVEINLKLQMALENDLTIEIEYFKNHDFHKVKGKLLGMNPLMNYIKIEDKEIPLDSISGAQID